MVSVKGMSGRGRVDVDGDAAVRATFEGRDGRKLGLTHGARAEARAFPQERAADRIGQIERRAGDVDCSRRRRLSAMRATSRAGGEGGAGAVVERRCACSWTAVVGRRARARRRTRSAGGRIAAFRRVVAEDLLDLRLPGEPFGEVCEGAFAAACRPGRTALVYQSNRARMTSASAGRAVEDPRAASALQARKAAAMRCFSARRWRSGAGRRAGAGGRAARGAAGGGPKCQSWLIVPPAMPCGCRWSSEPSPAEPKPITSAVGTPAGSAKDRTAGRRKRSPSGSSFAPLMTVVASGESARSGGTA